MITIIAGRDWDFYFFEVDMRAGIPFHKDHTQTCHHLIYCVMRTESCTEPSHTFEKQKS